MLHIPVITWLPPWLAVFVLSVLPLVGHGAIVAGLAYYHMSIWETLLLVELGNVVPAIVVYAVGDAVMEWKEQGTSVFHRLTHKVLHHAHRKVGNDIGMLGMLGLTAFVALPIPGASVWTGTLGAYLLGIPFKKAFPYILAGNLINGIVVTLATTGSVAAIHYFR